MKDNIANETNAISYLNCSDFYLGDQHLQVRSGSGGSLKYSKENYREIKMFFEMLRAGWSIPEWLRNEEWDDLQLVTLEMNDTTKLPEYSPKMPVTIRHSPSVIQHIVEKTVTLYVGKSRSFRFTDHCGDQVTCHINNVVLIDVWKDAEEGFNDPRYKERCSEEQLQEIKKKRYEMLQQSCPKGTCYLGIEYECSRDISLQFYSKEFLRSFPETHRGSSSFLLMGAKSDEKTGTHGLPLKRSVIQTAFPPDTTKVSAELFFYMEKVEGWEENVPV